MANTLKHSSTVLVSLNRNDDAERGADNDVGCLMVDSCLMAAVVAVGSGENS